jgi:flagellar biosynthesis/type III secretory pathway chaperone
LSWRSPVVWFAIGVFVTFALAVGVVIALRSTGDANAVADNVPLIAAVIALGGVLTTQMVSIAVEDRRARETSKLEDRRSQEAHRLEDQRANGTALQKYFEDVGKLLIEQPLRKASPGDNLSTVVRAQTQAVLQGTVKQPLEGGRKRILLRFLYESGLIRRDRPVISLAAADLRWAYLEDLPLSGADLRETNLRGANLTTANLSEANLHNAQGLTDDQLSAASSLEGATMPDGQILRGKNTPNGPSFEEWLKDRAGRKEE